MLWNSRSRRKFELDRTGICSQIGCQIPIISMCQRIAHEQLSTTKRNSTSFDALALSGHSHETSVQLSGCHQWIQWRCRTPSGDLEYVGVDHGDADIAMPSRVKSRFSLTTRCSA